MIARASEWLSRTLETNEGVDVTYTRGGQSIEIVVVPARVRPERVALMDGRAQLEIEPADFLVRPSTLDFGAGPVEPADGDRIELEGRKYEASPRDGEPSFRVDSNYRTMYRVRTIRVY